ncbi:MAG: hypothetical protein BGO01_06955 [Armatimonadetes bacterium 55-13]|nr:hypothetical protein [Armatimonadota bacterium]OJU62239.1 MAG: hypothetical protein BGO01_06955 [Armatimonadetes bacterium 55-13]
MLHALFLAPIPLEPQVIRYAFPPGVHRTYDIKVGFDGYLPLLGGQIAKAELEMEVDVVGGPTDDKGYQTATSEIKNLKLTMNGAQMPFGASNIQTYFPKTTISLTPEGKMVKTDAPKNTFPFRLPGLDPQRFPDITYLPLEFPETGIELEKAWTFKKKFGPGELEYTVTPTAIEEKKADLKIALAQKETTYEDAQTGPLDDEKGAAYKLETTLTGEGTGRFDRTLNLVTEYKGAFQTQTQVTDLETKKVTERKLTIRVLAALKSDI